MEKSGTKVGQLIIFEDGNFYVHLGGGLYLEDGSNSPKYLIGRKKLVLKKGKPVIVKVPNYV